MRFVVAFLLFFLGCAFVFPALSFYADFMNAKEWNQRTAFDYAGFTFCSAMFCILMASATYAFLVM